MSTRSSQYLFLILRNLISVWFILQRSLFLKRDILKETILFVKFYTHCHFFNSIKTIYTFPTKGRLIQFRKGIKCKMVIFYSFGLYVTYDMCKSTFLECTFTFDWIIQSHPLYLYILRCLWFFSSIWLAVCTFSWDTWLEGEGGLVEAMFYKL